MRKLSVRDNKFSRKEMKNQGTQCKYNFFSRAQHDFNNRTILYRGVIQYLFILKKELGIECSNDTE